MSLRDDVRWVCDAADGMLVGWLPGQLPKWTTKEGEKLGWLVLLLWKKFYEATMARGRLEAEVQRLKDDVDGLRATNERLTDMLDQPDREAAIAGLAQPPLPAGHYWVSAHETALTVARWDGTNWWFSEDGYAFDGVSVRVLSGPLRPPSATPP